MEKFRIASVTETNSQRSRFRLRPIVVLWLLTLAIGCQEGRPLPPASTNWVKWSEGGGAVFYYDPTSVTKDANFRRVWEVQDLKEPDEFFGARSRRLLTEYDCTLARSRHLYISAHSERLARGKVLVTREDAGAWRSIPSKTSVAIMLLIVCED